MNDEDGIYWGEYEDGTTWWDYSPPAGFIPTYNDPSVLGTPGTQYQPDPYIMNEDIYDTDDTTQTGGFWNDLFTGLGNTFGGAVQNTANAAALAAQQAAIDAIKKKTPAPAPTTANPGTQIFGMDQKSAITLGIVLLAGLFALRAS